MRTFELLRDGLVLSLPKRLAKFFYNPYKFAWIVHSRNLKDVHRHFWVTKILPGKVTRYVCKLLWPVIISEINGVEDDNGGDEAGCILGIPLLPQQILSDRKLAEKRIIQALKLLEKIGVENVVLGGYNSVITEGASTIYKKTKMAVTNSYALLSGLALRTVEIILNFNNKDFDLKFSVIGATTIPGRVLTKLLVRRGVKNILLIGKTQEHLEVLRMECLQIDKEVKVKTGLELCDINNSNFVIIATNSPSVCILPEHIGRDALVLDITQPTNPSTRVLETRDGTKVYHGLALSTPGINYNFNFGIPKEQAFPCLAEVILLAKEGRKDNFGVGNISLRQVDEIVSLARKYNFNPVVFNKKMTWG